MSSNAKSRYARMVMLLVCVSTACASSPPTAVPPPSPPFPPPAAAPAREPVARPFVRPTSLGPDRFLVLGPIPVLGKETYPHQSLDHDYLEALGGESAARFETTTGLKTPNGLLRTRAVSASPAGIDFVKLYDSDPNDTSDTNDKVAYAYAEIVVDRAQPATALFGSDDGAAVWLNGKRVHHIAAGRGLIPDEDRFGMELLAGTNRILVKVDNGYGGWGFLLRVFDQEGAARIDAIEARRTLESLDPRPASGSHLLKSSLPAIFFGDPERARLVFGEEPLEVSWFGPDGAPTQAVSGYGRYAALLESTTRDGYRYRRMLSFARVPEGTTPWFPTPPFDESLPSLSLPPNVKLDQAQAAELNRHLWSGGSRWLWNGEGGAIAGSALFELGKEKPPVGEPAWLASGFIRNAEYQLGVRMKLEGRVARPLKPPVELAVKAGVLRTGSESQAEMKPGTLHKIRAVAQAWAKADPHPFVVLVARRGVVFMHEGFNGFDKSSMFYPASIGKTAAALLFARAVDQGLVGFDQPLSTVFPDWSDKKTSAVTFRHCFYHVAGLSNHFGHGGLFNAYLDQDLLIQDAVFAEPGTRYLYNGDDMNLTGKALELITGKPIARLLYESLQAPLGETGIQLDLGVGHRFTAMFLGKLGQMLMQDGAYGDRRFYQPGFVRQLWPRRAAEFAPRLDDKEIERGMGLEWRIDPPGSRDQGVLGPNAIGHGAASGSLWRIAPDHELVIVVGRTEFKNASDNETWSIRLVKAVAEGLSP
jgi:CubicO group peptidase (beta-lactamase class C family)